MDTTTTSVISNFINYLEKNLQENKKFKKFKDAQIIHSALNENRVSLQVYHAEKTFHLFFDLRELKDNENRFSHLLDNTLYQLESEEKKLLTDNQ